MSKTEEFLGGGSETGTDDEQDWYFASETAEIEGPYMESELRRLYEDGKINDSTHVWNTYENDLHRDWIPIEKIKHLYPDIFPMKGDVIKEVIVEQKEVFSPPVGQAVEAARKSIEISNVDDDPFAPFSKSLDDAPEIDAGRAIVNNAISSNNDDDPFAPFSKSLDDAPDLDVLDSGVDADKDVEAIMSQVRGLSQVRRDMEKDIEKTKNLYKPPTPSTSTQRLDSVMNELQAYEVEMKQQENNLVNMNLSQKRVVISSDDETSSSDAPIQANLLDPNFAFKAKPAASVHRFTLEPFSDMEEELSQPDRRYMEAKSQENFSILLVGNKLRKLNNISPQQTIAQLRTIVSRVEKVPSSQVILVHRDVTLENDSYTINDYNVANGATVVVKILGSEHTNLLAKRRVRAEDSPKMFLAASDDSLYSKPEPELSIPAADSGLRGSRQNDLPPQISDQDMALEAYTPKQRQMIRDIVNAGFPQDSVIVAMEITNFMSKEHAMEWLLSDEFILQGKHETQRNDKGPVVSQRKAAKKKKKPRPVINQNIPVEEEKRPSVGGTWQCSVCTFANPGMMPYCEMCGLKKKSKAPPKLPQQLSRDVISNQDLYQAEMKVSKPMEVERPKTEVSSNVNRNGDISSIRMPLENQVARSSHSQLVSQNLLGSDRGNLKITLVAAVGLAEKANYCLLTLGKFTRKTKPLKKSKSLEFNEVFFFNGFKPDRSRQLRIALMVENKMRADKVVGQVCYAMPTTFNTLSHDLIELTNQKNQTAGLLIISVVILQHGVKEDSN